MELSRNFLPPIRVFQDKIKFYILRQNLHQPRFNDFSNMKWCRNKLCASVVYLDKHSTLDLVIVSVVSSILSGERHLFAQFIFLNLDVNSDLKRKSYREKLDCQCFLPFSADNDWLFLSSLELLSISCVLLSFIP